MIKEVITYDGSKALKSNCRKYDGKYYEIGRQCFKMDNGRYYRIDTNKIIYDYDTKKYVLKTDDYIKGIVGFNKKELIYGYFKPNKFKNAYIFNRGPVLNEDIITNDYVEELSSGKYYPKAYVDKGFYKKRVGGRYSRETDYSVNYRLDEFTKTFNNHFEAPIIKNFYKELPNNATYGIEYETNAGRIPENKCMKTGMVPVKDGSLRRSTGISFEYATIILNKNNVLHAVKEHCNLLDRYCTKSVNESLHIHIGGYERSVEMLVALYRTVSVLQKELYEMFPLFIKKTSIFKRSQKNYCKPLPKNRITYKDFKHDLSYIIRYLSDGNLHYEDFSLGMANPVDPDGYHKWNSRSRYSICNLNHFAFKGTGTIEFRIHTNTFNKDKIAAWLFIITSIVEYANKIKNEPYFNTKIDLSSIITQCYQNKVLKGYLKAYIQYRKDLMKYNQNVHKDFIGVLDVMNDNLNNFKFPIKELV